MKKKRLKLKMFIENKCQIMHDLVNKKQDQNSIFLQFLYLFFIFLFFNLLVLIQLKYIISFILNFQHI